MSELSFREAASNAIRFWERGRIAYNLVLLAIVASYFMAGLPFSKNQMSFDLALGLFVLAVLANVAYCAAYPVDIFAQFTAFNGVWRRARWVIRIIGMLFAATITRFFAMSMFTTAA